MTNHDYTYTSVITFIRIKYFPPALNGLAVWLPNYDGKLIATSKLEAVLGFVFECAFVLPQQSLLARIQHQTEVM